jgi:hypothetical protein
MQQQLQHCITALKITEQLPEGQLKNRQIDDLFTEISKLRIPIIERTYGDIRYRKFSHFNPGECREISVTVIQSEKYSMIIFDIKAKNVSFD